MKLTRKQTLIAASLAYTLVVLALNMAPVAWAQKDATASGDDEVELAKQTQNPVADLISIPFQSNFNFGQGPSNVTQYIMNVQPVIPISLNKDWNLITRTIMPIINQPAVASGAPNAFGLGDINPTFFLSPAKTTEFIWGVGPTFTLPTATDSLLGSGEWDAGPAAVALLMEGPWVVGALANQQWSFAGWGRREVSAMLIQPFINYNFSGGLYLTSAAIITADWETPSSQHRWTVPVGGVVGKLWRVGKVGYR